MRPVQAPVQSLPDTTLACAVQIQCQAEALAAHQAEPLGVSMALHWMESNQCLGADKRICGLHATAVSDSTVWSPLVDGLTEPPL